jgi:chitinase
MASWMGDTSPDAVLQGDTVLLRVKRTGNGNDRVYHMAFRAEDGAGGSCIGTVAICMHHDREINSCVDDGTLYNSVQS